jgi:hypothetical protein
MMKLSTEARSYAHTLFGRQEKEITIDRDNQLRRIVASAGLANPKLPEITDLLYEKHKQLLLAKVDSYLKAYRSYRYILDDEDEQEIRNELLNLTTSQFNYVVSMKGVDKHRMPNSRQVIPNVPQHLFDRFHNALEQAEHHLRAGKYEIALEANKPETNTSYSLTVEKNYGNIQQGGQGNTQNFNKDKEDEVK